MIRFELLDDRGMFHVESGSDAMSVAIGSLQYLRNYVQVRPAVELRDVESTRTLVRMVDTQLCRIDPRIFTQSSGLLFNGFGYQIRFAHI